MACKSCHKPGGASGSPPKGTKTPGHKDGAPGVQTHVGAFNKNSHGMAVPQGHGESGASVPVTAGESELAKAIDAYYTRTSAKRFVEAGD